MGEAWVEEYWEGMEKEKERDRIHVCGRQKCHGQIVSDFDFFWDGPKKADTYYISQLSGSGCD